MSAFKALFHSKNSLSSLPKEYYFSFKSFYKSLVLQNTFDSGALLQIIEISKNNPDFDVSVN